MKKMPRIILCFFIFLSFGCERDDFINPDENPPPISPEECVEDITDLSLAEIYDFIYQNEKPVIAEAYTSWCGECAEYTPIFQKVCVEYYGKVKFVKIDMEKVYRREKEWLDFFVGAVPSTYFFYEGEEIFNIKGSMREDELKKEVEDFLRFINGERR